jgi:regulator of protease activity HflC (stomatin/prohibitin superfamily)
MFGIRYIQVPPTTYLIHFKNGHAKKEGAGLSFFYYAPTSVLVGVPINSSDVPFVFHQTTLDFQTVTVQGQLQYRVKDPKRLAALLDFSISPRNTFLTDDPEKLDDRLTQATQVLIQNAVGKMILKEALVSIEKLAAEVLTGLRANDTVAMLGIEILGLSILSIKPTPEMAKALEAQAREELNKRSDEAIYARRHNAVEQERRIKDAELNTQLAEELKKREIRETQMAAEIAVELQRTKLIEQRVENERKDADAKAYALEAALKPIRETDPKSLLALAAGKADPRAMIAMAFRELAENAQKIGTLNVSPELLEGLLKK